MKMTLQKISAQLKLEGVNDTIELQQMRNKIYDMGKQLRDKTDRMNRMDELAPALIYESGMCFGELALMNKQPRQGTIVTLTDCHFAEVNADTYEKLLKKDNAMTIERNVTFIRQIPYITNWKMKETTSLIYKCKSKNFSRGNMLAEEGQPANMVYIIHDGEVEVIKQNLHTVFFNEKTAVVGVQEVRKDGTKGKFHKSTDWLMEEKNDAVVSGTIAYTGTEFQHSVQQYLRTFIDKRVNFKDKQRSQFN